jgi:acetyl esterase
MTLHPLLEALRHGPVRSKEELGLEAVRRDRAPVLQEPPEPVLGVEDVDADGVPVRLFRATEERPAPLLVYCFGGGWVTGGIDTVEPTCRRLANAAGCVVAAVGYRLAPEHPFPAALDDCDAATCWLAGHAGELGVDPARIAIGGTSAGGSLAALVCLRARDRGRPRLTFQLLVYPVTDCMADTPSMRECDDPYFLDAASMRWFWSLYLADPADADRAAPLRAADVSGLPPALVITAGHDPLRDEAELYAARLDDAEVARFDGMVHGFFSMSRLPASREAVELAAAALRRSWAQTSV